MSEGTDDEKISADREIELTGQFIRNHNVTWPVVFSKGSVFDERYCVTGIPRYVIIDSAGRIRCLYTGIGRKEQMARLIRKLLAEN